MAVTTTVRTTNGTFQIDTITPADIRKGWRAQVIVTGAFGGGTVTFFTSLDGGTTLVPVEQNGTAISFTTQRQFLMDAVVGSPTQNMTLHATLAGATAPNLTITVNDNRWPDNV